MKDVLQSPGISCWQGKGCVHITFVLAQTPNRGGFLFAINAYFRAVKVGGGEGEGERVIADLVHRSVAFEFAISYMQGTEPFSLKQAAVQERSWKRVSWVRATEL